MSTPIVRRRKRAIEVDTIQWLGDNEADVQAFAGGAAFFFALDDEDRENSDDPEATAAVFDCLHSTWILVYTGQHIVRGVKRELYPIAEDVLVETYDVVPAAEEKSSPIGADATPGEAYDGELAMLRGLVRTLRAVVRDDRADVAQREVRRLLYEHAADERDAYRRAMGHSPADTTPFFQPGHTYEYAALHILFRCDAVSTHPVTREPSAVGWVRYHGGGWSSGDYSPAEYTDGWTDVTEAGEGQ